MSEKLEKTGDEVKIIQMNAGEPKKIEFIEKDIAHSHPIWRVGETVRQKCREKKSKAKSKKSMDDIIEWLEALEERIEFLEARL